MKVITFFVLIFLTLSTENFSQSYAWNFIIGGNSLGNPIAVEKNNINNVYYGTGSQIFKSWDRGLKFTQIGTNIPSSSRIKCILLSPKDTSTFVVGIEVSSVDRVVKSTDRGQTWQVTGNFTFSFFGIPITQDLKKPDTLYTMDNARFLRSTDFGSTWVQVTSNVGCETPCDIEVFPDSNHIILIGDNGTGIFRSTNYGQTWTQVFTTSGEIPTIATDKKTPGVVWATRWGGGGGILKSTDYGLTWILIPYFNGQNMWGVDVNPNYSNYLCVGRYSSPSQISISKDGGLNWTTTSIPGSNYAIYIIDSMDVFAAQSTGFYKLDAPWFVPVELISFKSSVVGVNINLSWTTASELNNKGFEIQVSSDNSKFETIDFVPGFGTSIEKHTYSFEISELKEGKYFLRLAQVDFDGTVHYSHISEVDLIHTKEFNLYQNYPNPLNPMTIIRYELPKAGKVSLSVYDALGSRILELVNEEKEAGRHEIQFNANNLASGCYFYRIITKDFVKTMKMLVVK